MLLLSVDWDQSDVDRCDLSVEQLDSIQVTKASYED